MFETEYFRITESEFQLLRSRYVYKKVPFEQIRKLELTQGSRIKHPLRTMLFGISITSISIFLLFQLEGIRFPMPGEIGNPKGPLLVLIILGIMLFMGLISIFMAIVKTKILRTHFEDGTFEVFELKELQKTNQLGAFIQYLKEKFPSKILRIENNSTAHYENNT